MSHRDQFAEMLESASEPYVLTEGTNIIVGGMKFIFHIGGNLKNIEGRVEDEDEFY